MIDAEIAKRAAEFRNGLIAALTSNCSEVLQKNTFKIDEAYARLTCLQSLRAYLIADVTSEGSQGFFVEAQADGLTSLVLILTGAPRSALKSLRSLIENVIRSIYYADHPIEYRQWEDDNHRPTFKSLFDYLDAHPDLQGLNEKLQPQKTLHSNWKMLSQAVHSSAKAERMTGNTETIQIWKTTQAAVGKWATFQKAVIRDVCLLYFILYREKLKGGGFKPVRESATIALPKNLDLRIKEDLGIRLVRK